MLEHLKNLGVGALAISLALATMAGVIWVSAHYGLIILAVLAVSALAGAMYGLGWSIRNRYRLVRDGDSGEG